MSIWLFLAILCSVLFLSIGGFLIWAILNDAIDDTDKDSITGAGCFIILDGINFLGAIVFWIIYLFETGLMHW
jgi:hypothetical protein